MTDPATGAATEGAAAPAVTRPAGPPVRMPWLPATVVSVRPETARHRELVLDVPAWPGHRPGQHVDVRLTDPEDDYTVERSYSLATPGGPGTFELGVTLVDGGEVSSYLVEDALPGDAFEVRGPIGGYFVWTPRTARRPLQLIGGGSGVVPLRAMLLAWAAAPREVPVRLLYSVRAPDEAAYDDELLALAAESAGRFELTWTYTRRAPEGWAGYRRRVDRDMLAESTWPADHSPDVYVCGPTGFVETAAGALVDLGHEPRRIRTERFG